METFEKVKKMDLFKNLSENSINCLNHLAVREESFVSGETVSFFGDPLDYIMVILSGSLKTNEYTIEGKEIVSSYYNALDAFPFYLIYSGVSYLPYNVLCHKKARILFIPAQELIN